MGGLVSKKILIANGYHQDIYARVDTDKSAAIKFGATHIQLPSLDDNNTNVNEFTNELFKEKLFTKTGPGCRACFRVSTSARNSNSDGGEVYVTIALANGEFICRALAVQVNRCLTIDRQGNLTTTQHSMANQLGVGAKSSAGTAWKDFTIDGIDHGKLKKNV